MNWKRFFLAGLVIFVVGKGLDYLIETVVLMGDYKRLSFLRPDVMSMVWPMFAQGALVAFIFTYIFVRGRRGKGILEGVRFGIIIWLFATVPTGLGAWMLFPIPMALVGEWILTGLLINLIDGVLAAAIYRPPAPAKS